MLTFTKTDFDFYKKNIKNILKIFLTLHDISI